MERQWIDPAHQRGFLCWERNLLSWSFGLDEVQRKTNVNTQRRCVFGKSYSQHKIHLSWREVSKDALETTNKFGPFKVYGLDLVLTIFAQTIFSKVENKP